MLSVARSRFALVIQLLFLGFHSLGLLLAAVYSSKVPDMYEKNVHSKIGWIGSCVVVVQCVIGLVKLAASTGKPQDARGEYRTGFLPVSTYALQQHQAAASEDAYRYSQDSGHFTASEPSRSQSISSTHDQDEQERKLYEYQDAPAEAEASCTEKHGLLGYSKVQSVASHISSVVSKRTMHLLNIVYSAIDVMILPFGFITVVTGTVVYGGVFVGLTLASLRFQS